MNTVHVFGNLARDAEIRRGKNGDFVYLVVADNISKDSVIWWKVLVFGGRIDAMLPYLKKGSAIVAMGEMRKPEIYQRKDGTDDVSMTLIADKIRFSPFKNEHSEHQPQLKQQDTVFKSAPPKREYEEQPELPF